MTDRHHERVSQLMLDALELPPDDVEGFLDVQCADDPALRQDVLDLLRCSKPPDTFLSQSELLLDADEIERDRAAEQMRSDVVPERIGTFEILRVIGEGGMGTVYEAWQDSPRRKVALKVIRPGTVTRRFASQFEEEAAALARLQHQGIAHIYEAGQVDLEGQTQSYFAMELVEGCTLDEHMRNELPLAERLELLAMICEAVHHAHQKGIIHRDLKPANVMINEEGQPKVLDFGVARMTDSDRQRTMQSSVVHEVVGTLPYMSPEQVAAGSRDVDTRSDIYSLGVMAYEVLAGRLPFELADTSLAQAARIIESQDPPPLSSRQRQLRGDLQTIIATAMAKDPDHRYASASDLAADLRRFLRNEPITARPATLFYQARKLAARNIPLTVSVAAAIVIAIGAIIALSVSRARTIAAMNEAQEQAQRTAALNELLISTTVLMWPEFGSRELAPADLLDEMARLAESLVAETPDLAASIQRHVGNAYQQLGLYDRAEPLLRSAMHTQQQLHGVRDKRTLFTMAWLVLLLDRQNKLDEAEHLARETVRAQRLVAGPNAGPTLSTEVNLAIILIQKGELEEAESLLQRVIAVINDEYDEPTLSGTYAAQALGRLRRAQGEFEQAETLLRQAADEFTAMRGERDPRTLGALHDLAITLHEAGYGDAARPLIDRIVHGRIEVLGEAHPDTLESVRLRDEWHGD